MEPRHEGMRPSQLRGGLPRPAPLFFKPRSGVTKLSSPTNDDVIITAEFQSRATRGSNPAIELVALQHLAKFLSATPGALLNELARTLVHACKAGSAGITLEERRGANKRLQCVGVAGQLASEQYQWIPRHSPSGAVIDRRKIEIFRRPERLYSSLCSAVCFEELLVIPWELSSGRKGAIWVALHDRHRHLDQEDLRLVTALGIFANHALERSVSENTRRSSATLASAARVANHLAHEINNPLQALINSLYLASPGCEDRHLVEARLQADRLARLVRPVLEFKRQGE